MRECTHPHFLKCAIANVYAAIIAMACVEAASLLGIREVWQHDGGERGGQGGKSGDSGGTTNDERQGMRAGTEAGELEDVKPVH